MLLPGRHTATGDHSIDRLPSPQTTISGEGWLAGADVWTYKLCRFQPSSSPIKGLDYGIDEVTVVDDQQSPVIEYGGIG